MEVGEAVFMSWRFIKVQAFVVASVFSIAILLFAAQRHDSGATPQFHAVVDLSSDQVPAAASSSPTALIAPARFGGAWTLQSLPPTRLIAPLAVIEAHHKNFPDSEALVTMDDVSAFERTHGAVPQGAIVLLTSENASISPVFNSDALRFLVEARNVVGVGSAGSQIVSAPDNSYLAGKGVYKIENVVNLSLIPHTGMIGVAAPDKIASAEGPVRFMALVK